MRTKDAVGRYGEDLAADYLRQQGMAILDRNWRCPSGELDIIAREQRTVVIVEVKTRSTTAFGDPAEAITPAKAHRIHRLALAWAEETRASGTWLELRFDVIAIIRLAAGGPSIRHLRGAF